MVTEQHACWPAVIAWTFLRVPNAASFPVLVIVPPCSGSLSEFNADLPHQAQDSSGIRLWSTATMEHMSQQNRYTWCLSHQQPEDQVTPLGLVCPECKQRLYVNPPTGRCFSCWESQPPAYSLTGEPLFAYTLIWDDFRIRSLHDADAEFDLRSQNAPREFPVPAPHWLNLNQNFREEGLTAADDQE